jgi:hypothetical protein
MSRVAHSPVVPLGLQYAFLKCSTGLHPWLQPVATSWLKHNLNSLVTLPIEQIPDKSITPIR